MDLNITGILIAIVSYAVIGLFHPIVIRCQYHFTDRVWPGFLAAGLLFLSVSLFVRDMASIILSIVGAACLWSIHELREQTRRVEKGWFPKNPKHQ